MSMLNSRTLTFIIFAFIAELLMRVASNYGALKPEDVAALHELLLWFGSAYIGKEAITNLASRGLTSGTHPAHDLGKEERSAAVIHSSTPRIVTPPPAPTETVQGTGGSQ